MVLRRGECDQPLNKAIDLLLVCEILQPKGDVRTKVSNHRLYCNPEDCWEIDLK